MKKDKQGLTILKELIESGELKLKVRLKITKNEYIAIGTLTYQGKKVCMQQDIYNCKKKSDNKIEFAQ